MEKASDELFMLMDDILHEEASYANDNVISGEIELWDIEE
jgi:hypothetical protein